MKKIIFFVIGGVFIVALGCAFFATESADEIPAPFEVNTNSPYFVDIQADESISFSGDPATDFGSERLLYADPLGDATNATQGEPVSNFHEITDVYMAYSKNNLYIGFKSPAYPPGTTEWDVMYSGGSYIMIDNGIYTGDYSEGPTVLNNTGLQAAGISGQLGNFDQSGFTTTNDHKISLWIKHYRPANTTVDMPTYQFINGVAVKAKVGVGLSWNNAFKNGVTEVAIPLHYIFGDATTEVPTWYLSLRIDGALTEGNLSGHEADEGAVDWVPENDGSLITNWIVISNMGM